MSAQMNRLRGGRAVNWRTIVGLLLVPLTAAGVLLWGLWNPTERLDTVTAAVVNLDKPVTVDGQLVPLGRVLAAELIDGDAETNFTWQLTDEDDAAAGLRDGRYATVVTIPKNFSAAATSSSAAASGDVSKAKTATIDIETSERGRLLDSALSGIVTTTATSVLNEQLGSQFVGGIFVGMTEIGKGVGQAADGATQLANGGQALASGADQLASGATELANGTQQLAAGTAELSSGAAGLAAGAAGIAGGVHSLAAGAHAIADGDGSSTNPGLTSIGANLATTSVAVNATLDGYQGVTGGVLAQLQQMRTDVSTGTIVVADPAAMIAQLDGMIQMLEALPDAATIETLKGAGTALAAGTQGYAAAVSQMGDGADAFASQADLFASGMSQFAGGAAELAAGTPTLAAGTSQLAGGVTELASGAHQAADGTSSLAEGLHEAASGIPNYTKSERERLGEIATRPVEAKGASDELFNASGVPLFAGIALWAGAFASFLVLAPLWRRTREAARGVGYVALRSALPAAGLGALQGAVVGAILPVLLGYSFTQGLGFFGLALLAGVAFSLVNQGLSALFGGFGRFVSFALLVVAFAIGVISTAPPLLQAIGDGSPIGALFEGFQAVAMGASGAGAAAFTLALWGLAGFALTAFAVARSRKRPLA